MKKCRYCCAENPDEARFCGNCGHPFATSELTRFFPIANVLLGHTTVAQARANPLLKREIIGGQYEIFNYGKNCTFHIHHGIIDDFYINHPAPLMSKFAEFGFSWENSYEQWIRLLKSMDYELWITNEPELVRSYRTHSPCLSARFIAIAPDNSVFLDYEFYDGARGNDITSPSTLDYISFFIDKSTLADFRDITKYKL